MSDMPEETMKKIGLTGVMGAGKSSAIQILKAAGIVVVNCDEINASLLQRGAKGYQALVAVFQDAILDEDGCIDKDKMSRQIFANNDKKATVEAILHPLIKQAINDTIAHYQQEAMVVVEVPLLYEVKWESFFDEVWVVACDEDILLQRLSRFRKVSVQDAKQRLSHQLPQSVKIQRADVVFYNNHDHNHLKKQIYDILKENMR